RGKRERQELTWPAGTQAKRQAPPGDARTARPRARARTHPDLILLDLHLPDLGGEEVLARLRADSATCDIPVVVLSADATHHHLDEVMALGAPSSWSRA